MLSDTTFCANATNCTGQGGLAQALQDLSSLYPQILTGVTDYGPLLALNIACSPGRGGQFGLLLRELAEQGRLLEVLASFLQQECRLGETAVRTNGRALLLDATAPREEIDRVLSGMAQALEAVALGRSDIVLRHLGGKHPPASIPALEDFGPPVDLDGHAGSPDGTVCMILHPQDIVSLARVDTSLLPYDEEELRSARECLGRLLEPFVLPPQRIRIGRHTVQVDVIYVPVLGLPERELTRQAVARAFEQAMGLRVAARAGRVCLSPRVADISHRFELKLHQESRVDDGVPATHYLLDEVLRIIHTHNPSTLDNSITGQQAAVQVLASADQWTVEELADNSIVLDLYHTLRITPNASFLCKNCIYVSGAGILIGATGEALGGQPWSESFLPALFESTLRVIDRLARQDDGAVAVRPDFRALAERYALRIRALRGLWGDLGPADWAAFHRRRGEDPPGPYLFREHTAATPALIAASTANTNICNHFFQAGHLVSASVLTNPITGQSVTYAQLLARATGCAAWLQQARGLRRGEVVGLLAEDDIPCIAVMLACFMQGWAFCPINYLASSESVRTMLDAVRPRLILCGSREAHPHVSILRHFATCDLETLAGVCAGPGAGRQILPLPLDTPAVILFTSGSSGTPKAVVHSHGDFIACSQNYGSYIADLSWKDCVYTPSRIFFAYGLNAIVLSLCAGASHVLATPLGKPGPRIAQILQEQHVSVFFAVPVMFKLLLESVPGIPLPQLRLCISAGEALPARLFHRLRETLRVAVLDGIGATEVISTFISNRESDMRPGCTGAVVPGFEVKLTNERGELCRVGEVGSLSVAGNTLAGGYLNSPAAAEVCFRDGWFDTRDLFFYDAQSRFYHVGRATETFKINGCWFSARLMESTLQLHPAVKECIVTTFKDEDGLPRPKALVVLTETVCERLPGECELELLWSELRRLSKVTLGKDHYPHFFSAVPSLPRTASGKLIRSRPGQATRA